MNLLVVEDDLHVARFLGRILCKIPHIFAVDIVHSYDDALDLLTSERYDMLLLDVRLGHNDAAGIELCKLVRRRDKEVVVIVVTSYQGTKYLKQAFAEGANDYITKPFSLVELQMRVQRWAAMAHRIMTIDSFEYGRLSYNVRSHDFSYDRKSLKMTKQQKFLLLQFIKHPETLLSYQPIEAKMWGDTYGSHNIRSNIQNLRQVLEQQAGIGHWIQTQRGEGYLLIKK